MIAYTSIARFQDALSIEFFPDLDIYAILARPRLCVKTIPHDLNVHLRCIVEFEFKFTQ